MCPVQATEAGVGMTDLDLIEARPTRGMTPDEQALASAFYTAINHASAASPRSLQAAGHRIGVSDTGYCSEKVRRHLLGLKEEPTDKLAAFIGTALGEHIEQAYIAMFPRWLAQSEVSVTLVGDLGTFVLDGHPDLIDPAGTVVDVKTTRSLALVRRTGPSQQQQFQRHLYALGAHRAGLFNPGVELRDVTVANVWIDRSADEHVAHVQAELFDQRVVEMATTWLDDVTYAYVHGEPARKEPARETCFAYCGFAADCRGGDISVQGLIDDPEQRSAVEMYREGIELEKQAKRLKDGAKAALTGVTGSTGHYTVKWVKVAGAHIEFDRAPSERLDIRPVR
jgi:hypothetical protein